MKNIQVFGDGDVSLFDVGFFGGLWREPLYLTRAAIVAGLSLLAWWYGRRFHPLLLIMYVAALSGMISPLYVWADLGWWLSFLAFFGVLIVGPLMTRMLYRGDRQPSSGVQIIMESVAAQLMTLPIILLALVICRCGYHCQLGDSTYHPRRDGNYFSLWCHRDDSTSYGIGIPAEIILSYFVAVTNFLSSPSWSQQPGHYFVAIYADALQPDRCCYVANMASLACQPPRR